MYTTGIFLEFGKADKVEFTQAEYDELCAAYGQLGELKEHQINQQQRELELSNVENRLAQLDAQLADIGDLGTTAPELFAERLPWVQLRQNQAGILNEKSILLTRETLLETEIAELAAQVAALKLAMGVV